MKPEDFKAWAKLHCEHTGASAEAGQVLAVNFDLIANRWGATYLELCECTTRMIEAGRTPRFPNEHMNEIEDQLRLYRADRAVADATRYSTNDTAAPVKGCDCPKCMPPDGSVKWQKAKAKLTEWIKVNGELTDFFRKIPKR